MALCLRRQRGVLKGPLQRNSFGLELRRGEDEEVERDGQIEAPHDGESCKRPRQAVGECPTGKGDGEGDKGTDSLEAESQPTTDSDEGGEGHGGIVI
eukprot:scaffold230729_cov26-Tisochrysis_lutea.AAC.3